MNSLIKRTCEGAYFTHTAAMAASLQPHSSFYSDRPSPQSRVKWMSLRAQRSSACARCWSGHRSEKLSLGIRGPLCANATLICDDESHKHACTCDRYLLTVCGSGLGDSHSQTEGLKNSQMLLMRSETHKLYLQNYIHERLCSDDESTHFMVVGGLSNSKRWCSNSGDLFPQKIHSAQTNKQ